MRVRMCRVICRELARHGTLHAFLRHADVTRHGDVTWCRLVAGVAHALDFVHSRRLVHGNVTSHAVYVVAPHTVTRTRGVVVSGVRRMNEVNARRARLVPGWVTVFGRVYHLGM